MTLKLFYSPEDHIYRLHLINVQYEQLDQSIIMAQTPDDSLFDGIRVSLHVDRQIIRQCFDGVDLAKPGTEDFEKVVTRLNENHLKLQQRLEKIRDKQ